MSNDNGWRLNKPFVGIPTFLRAPYVDKVVDLDADIAVFGVPFDEGSPYLAGSRMGPRAIREHSLRFAGGDNLGIYDPGTDPATVRLDVAKAEEWIGKGAQVSPTVKRLLVRAKSAAAAGATA